MNLYKSKIIKSDSVRIVESKSDNTSGNGDRTASSVAEKATVSADHIEHAVREAFERGMSEGIKKGRDIQRLEAAGVVKAAEEAIRQTARIRDSIVERSESEIMGLIFAIAEKVIHHEVTVNKDTVKGVLKSAVEAINERENIRIKCNPDDMAVLKDLHPELLATVDGLRHVEFVEDTSINPGGIRIETGIGEVDARIDRQFDVIKNAVLS